MKNSYLAELLVLVLAGTSGILIYKESLDCVIVGLVLIFLNSYFVVTKLKEFTIKEYLTKLKETK